MMSRNHSECLGVVLSELGCFLTIFRNHEVWPRTDVSVHQMTMSEHKIFVLAHNATSCFCHIVRTWCEALSSRSPGERKLPKCLCVTFRFLVLDFGMLYWIITWSYGLPCQSLTLGNQNNMSGVHGCHWLPPVRKIVLEKIGITVSES